MSRFSWSNELFILW